ncbi:MAG: cyclic nucleotide-binding domain-containing protein [Rhizomicrobium sp.]
MSLNAAHEQPRSIVLPHSAVAIAAAPPVAPTTLHEHLVLLRDAGARLKLSRNEMIFQEGDPAQHIYRIVSGTIRLCRHTPDGRRHIAEFALAGDLFGVLGGQQQAFTAEAVGDAVLVAYSRTQLDRVAECDARFRANVLSHLSTDLLSAQLHTFILGCQSAKERVASFIVRFAERTGAIETGRLTLPMGRQDIADHLGLTIETVCRAITALKNDGVLLVPSVHELLLRNVEVLCSLAEGDSLH